MLSRQRMQTFIAQDPPSKNAIKTGKNEISILSASKGVFRPMIFFATSLPKKNFLRPETSCQKVVFKQVARKNLIFKNSPKIQLIFFALQFKEFDPILLSLKAGKQELSAPFSFGFVPNIALKIADFLP